MKVVIATPLYPPDVAEPAPYVKELATRLSITHQITVALYGKLPEDVHGVSYTTIDKQQPLLKRLAVFTRALIRCLRDADILYAENGASVELPAIITHIITRKPLIIHCGDKRAAAHATRNIMFGILTRITRSMARTIITSRPHARPEVLPFAPHPTEAFAEYERSWDVHLTDVHTSLLS